MDRIKMTDVPTGLVEETKAIIRTYLFLRYEVGLEDADKLSARKLLSVLKIK